MNPHPRIRMSAKWGGTTLLDLLARHRRIRAHVCSIYRYDRTGLTPTAICPECRRAP